MRFVTFVLPFDFLAGLFSYWATMMGDYSQNNANRGVQQNAPGAAAAAKAPTGTSICREIRDMALSLCCSYLSQC